MAGVRGHDALAIALSKAARTCACVRSGASFQRRIVVSHWAALQREPERGASEILVGGNSLNGLGGAARLQRAMAAADRAEALPPILRVRDLGAGFDEDARTGQFGFIAMACSCLAPFPWRLLAFADLGRGDFFALQVEGTSMDRISPEGSVIVVDRSDKQLVGGKPYIFSLKGGEATYKLWHPGDPAYLEPSSWDASNKPQFVKRMKELFVIGRVRRTLMDL
jgi:hypothetical protein